MSKAEPKFRRQPDKRPDQICDAAELIFSEHGFDKSTLDQVALSAGVTKGTIYLYFRSKEELYMRMMQRRAKKVFDKVAANVIEHGIEDFDSLIDLFLISLRQFMQDPAYPGFVKLLISESGRFPELVKEFFETVPLKIIGLASGIYDQDVNSGKLKELDPRMVMLSLIGMHLAYVITQQIFDGHEFFPLDRTEFERTVESIFRDGIRKERV